MSRTTLHSFAEKGDTPQKRTLERLEDWARREGWTNGAVADQRTITSTDEETSAETEQGDRMFADFEQVIRQMGGEGMSTEERHNRQLDALEGLRRFFSARGPVPSWWYETKAKVDRGEF